MIDAQLQILQHSLGRDQYGQRPKISLHEDYRNYFYTGPGCNDFDLCKALVKSGLMKQSNAVNHSKHEMYYFHVTDKGIDAVNRLSPKPPILSKAKKRYQQYLESECVESFGEWLKFGMYKPYES